MANPRFYIDAPDETFEGTVTLPPKAAHHAGRALRLASGERVDLFNGRGKLWSGTIEFTAESTFVHVDRVEEPPVESPLRMTLVQSWVSPEKMDWIVEKATEAGVSHIVVTPAERSVTRLSGDRLEKRLAKLREAARAAAEQCGRNVIPSVDGAASFDDALRTEGALRILLAPGAKADAPRPAIEPGLASIVFAVGPEGGFSPAEIERAEEAGWHPTLLGPRVFRTETAGLACAVWVSTLAGDFPKR